MAKLHAVAGVRPIDVVLTAAVAAAVELFVSTASGPGQRPLDAQAYLLGAVLALPVLFRRRWPLRVLIGCTLLLIIYYSIDRRNIPPTPLLGLPVYDAAVAGYLVWAIAIPATFMAAGLFVVAAGSPHGMLAGAAEFLPRLAGVPVFLWLLPTLVFPLTVVFGALVRGRHALAAETARRLRVAEDEREAEAARRVAEERLRIARELHDTVAHSMATITVQAGTALHLLGGADGVTGRDQQVRDALAAIRATSKSALSEMRGTLGQLRQRATAEAASDLPNHDRPSHDRFGPADGIDAMGVPGDAAGLGRLPALRDAVVAAGLPVTVTVQGARAALPDEVDHAAYRILQESLTNVLRHAGSEATATVRISYGDQAVTLEVTDDGGGVVAAAGQPAGHGVAGMAERAAAIGGELTAEPGAGGGFTVSARLPLGSAARRGP